MMEEKMRSQIVLILVTNVEGLPPMPSVQAMDWFARNVWHRVIYVVSLYTGH